MILNQWRHRWTDRVHRACDISFGQIGPPSAQP